MGRLTQAAREMRKKRATVNPQVIWSYTPDWFYYPEFEARLRHGINWVKGEAGREQCWIRDTDQGITIGVSFALPGPASRADVEIEAKRVMVERIEQVKKAAAHRAERERLTDIAARVEAKEDVGLDELRDLARSKGIAVNPESGTQSAGESPEENV